MTTHGHHQMVNTEIRLIIFLAAEDGVLYSQQKQDWELTVAQIMNSLLKLHLSSVHSLSHVQLFVTPWAAACQDCLSITSC